MRSSNQLTWPFPVNPAAHVLPTLTSVVPSVNLRTISITQHHLTALVCHEDDVKHSRGELYLYFISISCSVAGGLIDSTSVEDCGERL